MSNAKIFVSVIVVLVLGIAATAVLRSSSSSQEKAGQYDGFAQCLKDQGAVFYGAFWCPHCKAQKKMFGSSVQLLPYEECSTLDGKGQTQICIDKGVKSYPTWDFADGTRVTGALSFETLAEKTSCPLPGTVPAAPEALPLDSGASSPAN